MMDRLVKQLPILNITAFALLTVSLLLNFFYAPTEATMGHLYRLLYVHVGTAWVAVVTFAVALISGINYLRTRSRTADTVAMASVEVGIVFISITIATGSIWGKPAWNTWWVWSPRLTLVTVMWLAYVAYFVLRGAVEDQEKRFRFAAVYVIAAFVTVILTYGSVRILRDIHPVIFGGTTEAAQGAAQGEAEFFSGAQERASGIALMFSCLSFTALYIAWLVNRYRLEQLQETTARLKARLLAQAPR